VFNTVVPNKLLRCTSISIITLSTIILLSACGGSDAPSSLPDVISSTPDDNNESESCINEIYDIASAFDDGNYDTNFEPINAIDQNTHSASRWSSNGINTYLTIDLGRSQTVRALTIKWYKGAQRTAYFSIDTSLNNTTWRNVLQQGESSGRHSGFELIEVEESQARYIKIIGLGNSHDNNNSIIEVRVHSCPSTTGEYSGIFPNEVGIELIDWYLSIPVDEDNSGTSDNISETELASGYTNSEYFYASSDNGIVMRSPSYGFKTSANTDYVRVELREMLRRGNDTIRTQGVNKNNWVFGAASLQNQLNAGGVDGHLKVTLAVNQVTTTGQDYQIGRVVIGQIHANDDEPIRLYYRKLPGNAKGAIYFAHESRLKDNNGDNIETYVEMIGSKSNSANNPENGIALNEKFTYQISVNINLLTVTISREGKSDIVAHYNMANSGYEEEDQYHYFKVGVYNLNNSSEQDEYVQATFYQIKNAHTGYSASE